jgi:hypothetical protein
MSTMTPIAPAVKAELLARSWIDYFGSLFPDPEWQRLWQTAVARYLFDRRYHVEIARTVLAYATENGSVECCPVFRFDQNDRRAVEKLLPVAPPSVWARFDNDRYAISDVEATPWVA